MTFFDLKPRSSGRDKRASRGFGPVGRWAVAGGFFAEDAW